MAGSVEASAQIVAAASRGKGDELRSLVRERGAESIRGDIRSSREKSDLLKALFKASDIVRKEQGEGTEKDEIDSIVLEAILEVLDVIAGGVEEKSERKRLLAFITSEVDYLPLNSLAVVVDGILSVQQALAACACDEQFSLLPSCLVRLEKASSISIGEEKLSGSNFIERYMLRWIDLSWPGPAIAKMTEWIRDCPLPTKWLRVAVQSIFLKARQADTDFNEIPAICYHMLLLSSLGMKQEIVQGIANLVDGLEIKATTPSLKEQLRHVEGTIILHAMFAVKQDPAIAQEWLKYMRSYDKSLSHFEIVLLCTFAKVPRLEQQCWDFFRENITRAHEDRAKQNESRWLSASLSRRNLQAESLSRTTGSVFVEVISRSAHGWESIVPCLVSFAFHCIASTGTTWHAAFLLCSCNEGHVPRGVRGASRAKTIYDGIEAAIALFDVHEGARSDILVRSLRNLTGVTADVAMPSIFLIARLLQKHADKMGPMIGSIKETIGYITSMSPGAATGLLTALRPLYRHRPDVSDSVSIVLRKAMFSRDLGARLIAVRGFLQLVQDERRISAQVRESGEGASCSQAVSVHSDRSEGNGKAMFEEFTKFLRRSFTQQAQVREALYGALSALALEDASLNSGIAELISAHLKKFINPGDEENPFKLEDCVITKPDTSSSPVSQIVEPLHEIISCARIVVSGSNELLQDDDGGPNFAKELSQLLNDVSARICACTSESFNLEENEGESYAQEHAYIILGCLEVLIESALSACEVDNIEFSIRDLWRLHASVSQYLEIKPTHKTLSSKGKKRNGKRKHGAVAPETQTVPATSTGGKAAVVTASTRVRNPLLTSDTIKKLINGSITALKTSEDAEATQFAIFVMRCCTEAMNSSVAKDDGGCLEVVLACQGGENTSTSVAMRREVDIGIVGQPLLRLAALIIKMNTEMGLDDDKENKRGSTRAPDIIRVTLLCLENLMKISTGQLRQLGGHEFLCTELLVMAEYLSRKRMYKEVDVVLGVLDAVSKLGDIHKSNELARKVEFLCTKQCQLNVSASKTLALLTFRSSSVPKDLDICLRFARECENIVAMEKENDDTEAVSDSYAIVNSKTNSAIKSAILAYCDDALSDLEWLHGHLRSKAQKFLASIDNDDALFGADSLSEKLHAIERLDALILVINVILQSIVHIGPTAEAILKLCTRFYKTIAAFTKLFVAPKGVNQTTPPKPYERLVENILKYVTPEVYKFLSSLGEESMDTVKTKEGAATVRRELRVVPNLIYEIEESERLLISLGNAAKINFMRHAKRSTARDFRLKINTN